LGEKKSISGGGVKEQENPYRLRFVADGVESVLTPKKKKKKKKTRPPPTPKKKKKKKKKRREEKKASRLGFEGEKREKSGPEVSKEE